MSPYLDHNRVCDLVMKGGLTSGVVYPPAIDAIAKRAFFCGIGGTSAGAIAAALAAAAELRRRQGSSIGFEMLRELPKEISAEGHLKALFKPDAGTKRPFNVLTRAMSLKEDTGWLSRVRAYMDAGWLVSTQRPLKRIVDNGMGLCTGLALKNRSDKEPMPPLTEWLCKKLDSIAGIPAGRPLTFGDLWSAPLPVGLEHTMTGATSIQLQLIGTCLTFGRPFTLPHLGGQFAFSPIELRRFFPEYVVAYLEAEGRRIAAGKDEKDRKAPPLPEGLLPLPTGADLPVILAVRISLSFPILFAPIPLHYRNFSGVGKKVEPVFFADGGITSNLPVYFFDSPFPRWPTLAINLQYAQKAGDYGRVNVGPDKVWMAKSYRDGLHEIFHHFLTANNPMGKVFGLVGAIFRSAQVWSDNSFLMLPGYRDRVAEVWLDPHEGGMNLDMPPEVIKSLMERGAAAGERLADRFFGGDAGGGPTIEAVGVAEDAMSWDGHRWSRYRSNMAALMAYLRAWRRSIEHPLPGDTTIWDLLGSVNSPPNYKFRGDDSDTAEQRRAAAEAATKDLLDFIRFLDRHQVCMDAADAPFRPFCDPPKPHVVLQTRASHVPSSASRSTP